MASFFLNLTPAKTNATSLSWLYLFMAVVFLLLGGLGLMREYDAGARDFTSFALPLIQVAIALAYFFIAWKKSRPVGKQYVQVTEEQLELKLEANQDALVLPWSSISLLRVQQNKLMYRLVSGQGGEVDLESLPEEHEEAVRDALRTAGKQKGVSL
ncbi:hypothetical protein [Rufibacter sp. LB8]|uniref:hypothetical protein n=1 Tax=Rufibacter sp. LB8 TaxID=2777781 RepID=UPI00178C2E9C|nr:hypothetical protein [Rufibacter sp. LB8]